MEYIINLTETEDKALGSIAFSQKEWIENAAQNRARIVIDEIIQLTVQKCLENSIQIPGTKEEIVNLSFEKGWTILAKDINNEVV